MVRKRNKCGYLYLYWIMLNLIFAEKWNNIQKIGNLIKNGEVYVNKEGGCRNTKMA